MRLSDLVVSGLVFVSMGATALAQCPNGPVVDIDPSNSYANVTCAYSNGRYEIDINLLNTQGTVVTITVRAETTHDIKKIRIITEDGEVAWLYVHGENENVACGPVGSIYQEGAGSIALIRLYSEGPLGEGVGSDDPAIYLDQFNTLIVEGDVLRRIEIIDDSLFKGTIGGDLLGDVISPGGGIDELTVGGSIGSSGSPVNLWCNGGIHKLSCENLYADVDTLHYGGTGPIWELYIQSASESQGNFDGRIHCNYFEKDNDPNDGSDPARFVVSGQQLGEVDIEGTLRESVDLGTIDADATFTIGR